MTKEKAKQMIECVASQLSEHFEAVQILVSFPLEGGTQALHSGRGNWYARQGMAHDFIQREEAFDIAAALKSDE